MFSEQQIEQDLIEKLTRLKYVYRTDIRDKATLESNFRHHFEALNRVQLSDHEFSKLLAQIITPDVFAASRMLRERHTFERDDGTPLNFTLVNIKEWCKNHFEVINQLRINTDNSHHRYDVMLLINGVPVVQIELKSLAISPRRAMQQIVNYKQDLGNGYGKTLLCFLQLFIVSNRNDTWYFANNDAGHFRFDTEESFLPFYQFADEDNHKITQLDDFAEKFLAKCTLSEMISRYMVLLENNRKLMMMRPYQMYAVKAIVDCIHQRCGNGYIWHTTGSGKTLTSFKASTLLKDNPDIQKCLFVVDRKDLDRQTREEFNKFQAGCVEENTNTENLVQRLLSDDYANKVIVTTIQKLGLALDDSSKRNYKKRLEPLRNQRIVFIFDECHRSQFGENHKAIKEFFPNAQLFGFTGTPIFEKNATQKHVEGTQVTLKTTEELFQKQLHAYTITHAIEDRNVLRFQIDYYESQNKDQSAPQEPVAKQAIVEAVLAKHDALTADRQYNAILATSSISDAIQYYHLFKQLQSDKKSKNPDFQALNVACIFSPPAEGNLDVAQLQDDLIQEKMDNRIEPDRKKAALKEIINNYNQFYGTNFNINEFNSYYEDIQKRIKQQSFSNSDFSHDQKIDVVIVVDMLLTGFDSAYLNTLYVDKELKFHGLIQAFSRTNRILNDTKPFGHVMDFRKQQTAVDEAIRLFSGKEGDAAKRIWLADEAPTVIDEFKQAVNRLKDFMQSQGLACLPEAVPNLKGDIARTQFIQLFKSVQSLKTKLDQYTDLESAQKEEMEAVLSKEALLGFKGVYLGLAKTYKTQQDKNENLKPEIQQLDFEFVLFASVIIDYDYIMSLMHQYSKQAPEKQKATRAEVLSIIQSDAKFMDEREDMIAYLDTIQVGANFTLQDIREGYTQFKREKQVRQLLEIAEKHGLAFTRLKVFVDDTVKRLIIDDEELRLLLEPLALGWKARMQKGLELIEDLTPLLHQLTNGRAISGLNAYVQ